MLKKVAEKLDAIANQLESEGHIKEALEIDRLADQLDTAKAKAAIFKKIQEANESDLGKIQKALKNIGYPNVLKKKPSLLTAVRPMNTTEVKQLQDELVEVGIFKADEVIKLG